MNKTPLANLKKYRGIPTTQEKIHEDKSITIKNRLDQLCFSLPRIDDRKRFAGFPGLSGTGETISNKIPECKFYIEAFSGAAKVYQELIKKTTIKFKHAILNEKSNFINSWLRETFPKAVITNKDFIDITNEFDSIRSFFLFDPPWFSSFYDQSFSCFDRKNIAQYDIEVLKLCETLQGDFIITTRKENTRMLKAGYSNYLVKSNYVVCGKYPQVLLTTNLKLDGLKRWNLDRLKEYEKLHKNNSLNQDIK